MVCSLFFSSIKLVRANTINQGNASSTVDVHTDVSGEGTATTHIETTANSNTKTLNSNQPGDYHVQVNSDGTSSITTSPTLSTAPTTSPSAKPMQIKNISMKAHTFFDTLKNFFKNLFKFF